ncbi:MAG: flagellar hook assembly protein FlgD, partial [Rhodospirillaceae bacterium]
MVDAVSSITASTGTTNSETSKAKLAEDLDTFLTLLTSQLQNQDPLSPMDSTEFTNQLVQFAQVEQQIYMNENLEDQLTVAMGTQQALGVSYIGQYVEAESSRVALQDGEAVFTYGVGGGEAAQVNVVLYDENGSLVKSFDGEVTAGLHKIYWDGTDFSGNDLPDGTYTISVTATQRGEEAVETYTTSVGKVTGVASGDDGSVTLAMDGVGVTLDKVLG